MAIFRTTGTSPIQNQPIVDNTKTIYDIQDLKDLSAHVYTPEEIKTWRVDESIEHHPLAKKPTAIRSKLAFRELIRALTPTKKYCLPGQVVLFKYNEPKYKDELEYYDATPFCIFFGITRTKDNNIREIAFNLHYFPPYARMKIMNAVFEVYRAYYEKYFNESPNKPNKYINYDVLKRMLKKQKIGFGLRMYIPVLRKQTYVLPTKMIPTGCFTEGHFNGATLANIRAYWRKAARK